MQNFNLEVEKPFFYLGMKVLGGAKIGEKMLTTKNSKLWALEVCLHSR